MDVCLAMPVNKLTPNKLTYKPSLKGNKTWVALPPEAWPDEWKKAGWRRPVVILKKALIRTPR